MVVGEDVGVAVLGSVLGHQRGLLAVFEANLRHSLKKKEMASVKREKTSVKKEKKREHKCKKVSACSVIVYRSSKTK